MDKRYQEDVDTSLALLEDARDDLNDLLLKKKLIWSTPIVSFLLIVASVTTGLFGFPEPIVAVSGVIGGIGLVLGICLVIYSFTDSFSTTPLRKSVRSARKKVRRAESDYQQALNKYIEKSNVKEVKRGSYDAGC